VKPKTIALTSLLLALPMLAAANVYRCTDAQGKVTYQAQPCADAADGRKLEVEQRSAPPAPPTPVRRAAPAFETAAPPAPALDPNVAARPAAVSPLSTAPAPATNAKPALRVVQPANQPPGMAQWGTQADTLAVSSYEFVGSATQVLVDHPARPVLLVLSSYHAATWKVQAAPGTRLLGIVVGSYETPTRVQGPAQVPVVTDELPYAYEADNINFRTLIRHLNSRYGVTQLTALRGSYKLPESITLRGPYVADPLLSLDGIRPEVAKARMNFELLSLDGRRLPWTNTGPREGQRFTGIVRGGGLWAWSTGAPAAVRDDGKEAYLLDGNGSNLLWLPQGFTGPKQKLVLPKTLPELSWGSALAWDQAKGVLAMVSFGGEGFFYRYDTRRREWLGATSLNNRDLTGLAHDPDTGRYVGIANNGELLVFNARGEMEEVLPLIKQLADVGSVYDRGNRSLDSLSVAVQGPLVAIVNVRDNNVTHIWTCDLRTRKAQLTYKAVD